MRRFFLVVVLAGCTGEASVPPTLEILAPADGATVCGAPLAVQLEVQDFTLVPVEDGGDPVPNEGHADVYLNGQPVMMTAEPQFELTIPEAGMYQLRVDLVRADHVALDPYVGEFVYVEVDEAACP